MHEKIDWRYLFSDIRARIYLLWAVLSLVGFAAGHFVEGDLAVNGGWVLFSAIGLGYMYHVMPMRMKPAKQIFYAWFIPIVLGLLVSFSVFYFAPAYPLIPYLGSFWLIVMAAGFFFNGLYDAPAGWYWIAAGQSLAAAAACVVWSGLQSVQWLIAAIVITWAMLDLWIFRSEEL